MNHKNLWVGKPKNGSKRLYVFDEFMQHKDASMVNLFCAHSSSMKPYDRRHLRSILAPYHDAKREVAISSYLKWHDKNGADFLTIDRERHIRELEEKRNNVIEKHKEFVEKLGVKYHGTELINTGKGRKTRCYRCKRKLDSEIDIQCALCHWIICLCGACGCGYSR
jgi:PP-loop superfamily ATP-utilizing enzyme